MRLQGKRNRGKEEVKFLEIKGDDQLSGNQQWMTKSMTEEKQTRQSFSKVTRQLPFLPSCFLLRLKTFSIHTFDVIQNHLTPNPTEMACAIVSEKTANLQSLTV